MKPFIKIILSGRRVMLLGAAFFFLFTYSVPAHAARIKDIAAVEGVRENPLIGYGLVIGLNGTGDRTGTLFTVQSLASMLNKLGVTVNSSAVKVKNVAAVMVTAKLPPFTRAGSRVDVLVSSVGDAASLQGGTLIFTPLKGPDQQVYALAQGSVSIGGFIGGKEGDKVQKNHPTVGSITGGAVIEKEVEFRFEDKKAITLLLRQPDFTTAMRVAQAVNAGLGQEATARPVNSGTVRIEIPESYQGRLVEFLGAVEGLEVTIDAPAKVVVSERTGTIVLGENVRISDVAVAHGNLTIRVQTRLQVSQPPSFAPRSAETVVVPQQETTVTEGDAKITVLQGGATIGEVVRALNAIGVTPRDLISILQAIKAAGALHAELEIQ